MGNIFIDTETTGFVPGQICQLTLIHEEDFNIVASKNYYFKVDQMTPGAQEVHGLSIEFLDGISNGLRFEDYKDELMSVLGSNTLIAHNLGFDEKFISSEFWRLGISFKPAGRLDTMEFFKPILQIPAKNRRFGPYKNPSLHDLVNYFNIDEDKAKRLCHSLFGHISNGYHDSRLDTTMLYLAVTLHRENLNGGDYWHKMVCKTV